MSTCSLRRESKNWTANLLKRIISLGPGSLVRQGITFGVVLSLFCLPVWSLTGNGTILGTVHDETGAVLPGVTVTVRNESNNTLRTGISNDSGLYRIPSLVPQIYELRAELPGFKTFIDSDVSLTVGQVLRVDLKLSVGSVEEFVTVKGQASLVQVDDSQLSSLVDDRRVVDLPLNGRNVYVLATFQPGVVPAMDSVANAEGPNSSAFFAAGSRFRGNNFILDGQTNTDDSLSGLPAVTPSVDAVKEYRLVRNNFSAEFGTHSAAVINVVTRSGSNDFHGSLWEFHRNDALDAAEVFDPFNAETGQKDKAPLIQNQFGFTLGGPIITDKVFFFGSYEGYRRRSGESQRVVVETPEFRQWVIGQNPSSIASQLFSRFPAPAPTQNIQSAGELDPQSTSFINPVLPPSDLPVLGTVDSFASKARDNDQFSLRLDTVFNQGRDHLFSRYFLTDLRSPDATIRRAFGDDEDGLNQSINLSLVHEFSPHLINESSFGYLYIRSGFVPGSDPDIPTIFIDGPAGIQGAAGPNVGFPGAFGSIFAVPQFFKRHTFQWQDSLAINLGRHALRTGVDFRKLQENGNFGDRTRPFFIYQGIFDFANDSPFLMQAGVDPLTGAITDTPRHWRSWEVGAFVQDDWKLHPRMTLNLGLRWDFFEPASEKEGRLANVIFPDTGDYFERIAEARVGAVDQLYQRDLNNFAPRVGFAWDFIGDGKTVLRGGYGVAYEKLFTNVVANARFNPPYYGRAQLSPFFGDQVQPFLGSDPNDPFGGFLGKIVPGADLGLDERGGIQGSRINLRVVDPNLRDSYVQNMFLGVQRHLASELLLEVNYQGTLGRKLPSFGDPNRFAGDRLGAIDPLGRNEGSAREERLNPSFQSFNLRQNRVSSNYHGLNARLNRSLSKGLAFQFAYTLGKALDYGSDFFGAGNNSGGLVGVPYRTYLQDALNESLDYGRSSFDIRQRFVVNFLWEVPYWKHQTGWRRALAGWQVNSIVPIQSGLPFGVINGGSYPAGDYNADGQEGDRPDAPIFGNQFSRAPSTRQFIEGVFGPEDFPTPAEGTNGNLGRNTFTGPSFWTIDMSAFKEVPLPLTDDSRLQFRVEFFNLMNRVNLYLPMINLNGPSFGRSNQAFDAREIQFALKLRF